uniref:Uncharacterized protein n=1 Tax=Burkholderia cenocepacia TaxID=95486 RepID=A0A071MH15_9BURK
MFFLVNDRTFVLRFLQIPLSADKTCHRRSGRPPIADALVDFQRTLGKDIERLDPVFTLQRPIAYQTCADGRQGFSAEFAPVAQLSLRFGRGGLVKAAATCCKYGDGVILRFGPK